MRLHFGTRFLRTLSAAKASSLFHGLQLAVPLCCSVCFRFSTGTAMSASAAGSASTLAAARTTAPTIPAAEELDAVRDVAVAAAKQAGVLIRSRAGLTAVDHMKASSQDLVTVVDKACQDLISGAISSHFPHHAMLGEEDVAPGSAASTAALAALADKEWLWVVDPLDGTTNFVHGLPNSVVSIGVAHRGEVVVAVIFNPYLDELFTAVRGGGAFVNGQRMRVADTAALRAALFAAGFHHTPHVAATMVRGVGAMLGASRGVRSFGSAALHLAYTALGRLTGFWELDLSSWDIAAGALLVAEAGGRVTDTRGAPYTLAVRDVLATNGAPGVHDAALAVLAGAGADRPDAPAAVAAASPPA